MILLASYPAVARAGDGFGSVWGSSTHNSITLQWSDPTGDYRHASSPPKYKICYKKAGQWVGACGGGQEIWTGAKPYAITGLAAKEEYKVKVFTYTEKRNIWGKWKNPEYRKVGTLTQATVEAPSDPRQGSLELAGISGTALDALVTWSHPGDFEFMRVCYKRVWSLQSLEPKCRNRKKPAEDWGTSTEERGWKEVQPALANVTFTLSGLKPCRQYKIVAYGFPQGVDTGTQIGGDTKGHLGLSCRAGNLLDALATDYEAVLGEYIAVAERVHGDLFAHLAGVRTNLREERLLLEQEGENIDNSLVLIEYLIEAHPDVLAAWQTEPALIRAQATVDAFLRERYPGLHSALMDEIGRDEHREIVIGHATSVTLVVDELSGAEGFGAHISTSPRMDGFGGSEAECYVRIAAPQKTVSVECYDGYRDERNHANQFRLELGPVNAVSHVTFTVTRREVAVQAVLLSTSPSDVENAEARKAHTVDGHFPLREETGFFSNGKLFYRANGVLSGRQDRAGRGFALADPVIR